jgi:hypothetical protein
MVSLLSQFSDTVVLLMDCYTTETEINARILDDLMRMVMIISRYHEVNGTRNEIVSAVSMTAVRAPSRLSNTYH